MIQEADVELRRAKSQVHRLFDPLWRQGYFRNRSMAYQWLAKQMQLTPEQCHIGMFDLTQCQQALKLIQEQLY